MTGVLEGRVALVTGASRGMGQAIARAFAAEGARLVLAARSADAIAKLAEELSSAGADAVALPTDVRQETDIVRLVEKATSTFGRLDIVVNNAGAFVHAARFPRLSEEEWDDAFDVNLKAPWLVAKHAAPAMGTDGCIINLTSGLAHVGPARGASTGYAPYSIAKAALEDLTRILAERVKPRVNAVNPGVVRTEMSNGLGIPPEVVVPMFVWLASEEAKDVTGQVLRAQDWLAERPHLNRRARKAERAAAAGGAQ